MTNIVFFFVFMAFTILCNTIALVALAFAGSIGMTFLILACALPQYKLWWPFIVIIFYILTPLPTFFVRHRITDGSSSNSLMEAAIFITMVFIVSAFAFPIILVRADVILWGACYLTLTGNIFVYITMIIFFLTFDQEDADYHMW